MNNLGYDKNLFILPFDHRASFAKMFGFTNLTSEEKEYIIFVKQLIYEAFKNAVAKIVPKDQAAILVDEEYGDEILKDAKIQGFTTLLTTEKSGEEIFTFEYKDAFAQHIEKYEPTFAKALVHYKNGLDLSNLKILSDYCRNSRYKFLVEIVTGVNSPTAKDVLPAIDNLRSQGIEPDVWKLEGMPTGNDYETVVAKIQDGGRSRVGLVILGRGESLAKVEQWIEAGRDVKGVIGFAVGRTMFSQSLINYKNGKIDKEKTIEEISNNFQHLYKLFINQD